MNSSIKKVFLTNLQMYQENICPEVFFEEVSGWSLAGLLTMRLRGKYFSCECCITSTQTWAKYCKKILEINEKNGVFVKCFTGDFLQISSRIAKISILGGRLGTSL